MRSLFAASVALLAAASTVVACSSSSSSAAAQCNAQPFTCAAGTTCWPKDTAANFACLPSGAGKKGDTCNATPNAATCGDGLMCLQQTATDGHCVPYCDDSHACATGQTCTPAELAGTTQIIHVCFGAAPPLDAGGGKDAASE